MHLEDLHFAPRFRKMRQAYPGRPTSFFIQPGDIAKEMARQFDADKNQRRKDGAVFTESTTTVAFRLRTVFLGMLQQIHHGLSSSYSFSHITSRYSISALCFHPFA